MFKIIIVGRKPASLSRDEFISFYENVHIKLTNELVGAGKMPPLLDYRRNYVQHNNPLNAGQVDFDVITEVVFEDQEGYAWNRRSLKDPEIAEIVRKDMEQFLNLENLQFVVVDEYRGGGEKR